MKAVILAGGKGTRMNDLTKEIPKPMLKVGGIPILEHQILLLKKYGITDILITVNYLKDNIISYFGKGEKLDVNINYFEEVQPLGTVGGIKELENELREDFLVVYGDVMVNMHLGRFIEFHKKNTSECTLVLHPNDHPFDSDLVDIEKDGRITRFYSKPHSSELYYPNMVNAGVYIFSPIIFPYLKKGVKADFGADIFPSIVDKVKMFGYNTAEYLKDMGTPERMTEVENDFKSGRITQSNYEYKQKAIFLDRDGVINEEISFISRPEDLILYDFTADALRKINQSDYKAIVVTNQSVIARNLCTVEDLKNIHNKMESDLGKERARLDAIYYCPHHPDKGYTGERSEYKIDCECRKPKPGMLLEAAADFNLDLSKSFIIGDNDRDVLAGQNAHCTTVGVMTGFGLKKSTARPDFFFENLAEAVDYLIPEPQKQIFEKIRNSITKSPAVISVGGNSRSGKSTLASYLKLKFEQEKKKVLKIQLDNWIKPETERNECKNVFDRYRMEDIVSDIRSILSGEKININSYVNHPDRKSSNLEYFLNDANIVIIEGVVALSNEELRNFSHLKIFVGIEASEQFQRFKKYYQWRGKTLEDIENLYKERSDDEYGIIEKDIKFADIVVTSTP